MTIADACGWMGAGLVRAQPACSPEVLEQDVVALLCKYVRLHFLSDLLDPLQTTPSS